MFVLFINKNGIDDIGVNIKNALYHTILFKTSYYNGYSMVRGLSLLLKEVKGLELTSEERIYLNEPVDEISLYEFFTSEYTEEPVERFIYRLVKIIELIHHNLEGIDDDGLSYINRRYSNVIFSANSLLETFIDNSSP